MTDAAIVLASAFGIAAAYIFLVGVVIVTAI
jgi:hypothetical protein